MYKNQITSEKLLYLLAFSLALSIRFLNLGATPLSDIEATLALNAWDLSYGILSNPAYVALTRGIFFFLGSSNALARFWPVIAGSTLVLIPTAFRSMLGRSAALILAFGLALEPGLVSISRLAGSSMMAISFTALAFATFYNHKPALGGIFSAFAILSGPSIWIALTGAIIFGLIFQVWIFTQSRESSIVFLQRSLHQETITTGLKYGFGAFLIIGTLFFASPIGLSAWSQDAVEFFKGWVIPSGVSSIRVALGLILYAPLAIIFCFVMVVKKGKLHRPLVRVLSLWIVSTLVGVFLYPGRQVDDAAWVLIPIWILAAIGLSRYWQRGWREMVVWGQAVTQIVVLALMWLILAGSFNMINEEKMLLGVLLLGLLGFVVLTFVFVGLGWSWLIAREGLALGLGSALVIYGLAIIFSLSQVNPANPAELWTPQRSTGQADLLVETLIDLSLLNTGQANNLNGIAYIDSPALRWALRDFSDIVFSPTLEIVETTNPSVVLALPSDSGKLLTTAYRGQDFVWQMSTEATGALPSSWSHWLITREAPMVKETIVLWVREDLFLGKPPY